MRRLVLIAVTVIAGWWGFTAGADVIELTDGRVLEGEVVGEGTEYLDFRVVTRGLTSVVRIDRTTIVRHDVMPVSIVPAPDPEPEVQPQAVEPHVPVVGVIPMHGQIGGLISSRLDGTIQPEHLAMCFEVLNRHNTRLVILDLDSHGGDVASQQEICRIIREWSDRFPIVAYVHDAIGPAAVIALSCDRIAVRPESRIGAATILPDAAEDDGRLASVVLAQNRVFVTQARQPFALVEAMAGLEPVLWWSRSGGFSTRNGGEGAIQIDGPDEIPTLNGVEAFQYGLAAVSVERWQDLPRLFGVDWGYQPIDFGSWIDGFNRKHQDRIATFDNLLREYKGVLADVAEGLGIASSVDGRAKLNHQINRAVRCVGRLGEMDVEMCVRILGYDRELAEHIRVGPAVLEDARSAHFGDAPATLERCKASIARALELLNPKVTSSRKGNGTRPSRPRSGGG